MPRLDREPFYRRYPRRFLTVPIIFGVWFLSLLIAPVALLGAMIRDLAGRKNFAMTRAMLMAIVYFSCQVIGITWSTAVWLGERRRTAEDNERRYQRIKVWWARAQFRAAVFLFRLQVHVEGQDLAAASPMLLFIRHVSVVDNLVPANFVERQFGTSLRYVLNASLLRDPCIDLVGNRLPNTFVRGGTENSERMISRIRELVSEVGEGQGLIIFPEGTLFSPEKRLRLIEKLKDAGEHLLHHHAVRYTNVLPPRLGGAMALLEARPDLDVVFCAHAGLDDALTKASIANGGLTGRALRVKFWRVPAADIPRDEEGRRDWLFHWWGEVDRWISANQE